MVFLQSSTRLFDVRGYWAVRTAGQISQVEPQAGIARRKGS